MSDEMVFISTEMLIADALKLSVHVPHNCSGIVGVARSGLLPATALATHLQLPLYEFSPDPETNYFRLREISSGTRGKNTYRQDGPLFVVDDSTHSGTMARIVRTFFSNKEIVFAVVYAMPDQLPLVDVYRRILKSPHLLEWNLFNTTIVSGYGIDPRTKGGFAFDFDGIFCYDPPPDADHSPTLEWLINARPTSYLPRAAEIPLIVTMRLESWREETENWLRRYGISWKRLEMCKYNTAQERDANRLQAVIEHKVKHFMASECSLFVESDPEQSALIHQLTGKPVLCPIERRVYQQQRK